MVAWKATPQLSGFYAVRLIGAFKGELTANDYLSHGKAYRSCVAIMCLTRVLAVVLKLKKKFYDCAFVSIIY